MNTAVNVSVPESPEELTHQLTKVRQQIKKLIKKNWKFGPAVRLFMYQPKSIEYSIILLIDPPIYGIFYEKNRYITRTKCNRQHMCDAEHHTNIML